MSGMPFGWDRSRLVNLESADDAGPLFKEE